MTSLAFLCMEIFLMFVNMVSNFSRLCSFWNVCGFICFVVIFIIIIFFIIDECNCFFLGSKEGMHSSVLRLFLS